MSVRGREGGQDQGSGTRNISDRKQGRYILSKGRPDLLDNNNAKKLLYAIHAPLPTYNVMYTYYVMLILHVIRLILLLVLR